MTLNDVNDGAETVAEVQANGACWEHTDIECASRQASMFRALGYDAEVYIRRYAVER